MVNANQSQRACIAKHRALSFWLTPALVLGLVLFSSILHSAEVQPYIKIITETPDVFAGDAIILDIEHSGLLVAPDFEILKRSATFERETYGTRIGVFGGKVVEIKIRRMEFSAEHPGVVLFGPLTADDITSNSIAVKVREAGTSEWQISDNDAFITLTLTPPTVYVHQQQILDLSLTHQHPIAGEHISLPELADFQSKLLINERRTIDPDTGLRTTAWRYLVFPDKSGQLTPGNVSWSGTLVKSRTERAAFSRQYETSEAQVKPAAAGDALQQTDWWLPADSLSLTEEWSSDLKGLKAGAEVIRTLTLSATGVTSGQLPVVTPLQSRSLVQTLIDQQRSEKLVGDTLTSTATFQYRVKAQSPIPVFLDTVRVAWWNTRSDEFREAIIPARRVNVGLPEREDLLAELAASEKKGFFGHSVLLSKLQGLGWLRALAHGLLALTIVTLCLWLAFKSSQKVIHYYRFNKYRNLLVHLAENERWAELNARLSTGRRNLIGQSADNRTKQHENVTNSELIKKKLSTSLYSVDTMHPDKKEILNLVRNLKAMPIASNTERSVLPTI